MSFNDPTLMLPCDVVGICARQGDPACTAPHPACQGVPEGDGTCALDGAGVWPLAILTTEEVPR